MISRTAPASGGRRFACTPRPRSCRVEREASAADACLPWRRWLSGKLPLVGSTESRSEAFGDGEVPRREFFDGANSESEQRRVDAAAEDVEDVLDSSLAVGGEAPQIGA